MRKGMLRAVLVCALFTFLSVVGFAQESSVKGNLVGTVMDSTGAVVPGAKVTATGPGGNYSVTSDNSGNFSFTRLDPGQYTVKVERQGFKAADVKGAVVAVGRTANLRISLAPGVASETVEVNAAAVTVDTTSTASGANLSDTFYSSVPVPRNVSGLFYVAPGVDDSGRAGRANPSIAGGSGLENQYVADGVNITDPAFGGLGIFTRTYGSVGTGINLSFIKEVQVKTGGFEPQYGGATGGVVQIVTKSGGNAYHGMLAGFFAPVSGAATPKQIDNFRQNFVGQDAFTANGPGTGLFSGPGSYDVDAELGGYIPHFRDKLFFFGSYNPTLDTDYVTPPATAGSLAATNGIPFPVGLATSFGSRPIYTRAWINNYAAKLTFKINNSNTFETSVFGDPTSTNNTAFRSVTAKNTTVFSSQQYQTRNFVGRYNGTLSPTWLVNADVTWNHNEFTETPQNPDVFSIVDRTTSITPTIQGLGFVENHNADNFSYEIDTSKTVRWLGTHTFMLGGTEQFLNYDDIKSRTGGTFSLPGIPTPVNATFSLRKAPAACTSCPFFTDPLGDTVQVLLLSSRSEFGPPVISTEGLGMAIYGQDTWTINKHLNFNLGLRWDQYRMKGVQSSYTFTDNWAPRLGIAYDPFGDRKSKLYLNWARYNYQMPLDAAIRSLSQELDLVGLRIAPEFNPDGTINVIPDAAHILNGQFGFAGFATSQQALEGFAPGTKMQYEDEYVGGIEHDFGHGLVVSARYVDRRLRRVVEDMGGVSPEAADASDADGNFPLAQIFSIGNPSSTLDLFTNEPAPTIQPVGSPCGGAGVVASTDANGNNFPGDVQACFSNLNGVNGLIGGSPVPDGIPDGFANPVRNYQAAEFEVNKGFSAGWLMRFNYRLAYLRGNYEGAFRNDNGQTDPSISSLFDFTTGKLNLLGDQFAVGPLNTDRHHVGNLFLSYTFGASDFMKRLSGLTLGTGMRIQSGTPISEFADHPVYGNAGEVPLGGRGKLGRTQPSGAIDLHGEYAHKMSERYTFKLGADLFNVTNSQPVTLIDQNRDLSFNAPGSNLDFRTPLSFQNPFYSRFSVKLEF